MNAHDVRLADLADREEGRFHDVRVAYAGRMGTDMASGRAWLKYNAGAEQIWFTDLYGKDRWMTRTQVRLYQLLLTMIDNGHVKMRDIAEQVGVSLSTVSRTMAKLMAWGLLAYVSARGRYGGTFIIRRTSKLDGFERFAQKARDRIKRSYLALQARLSRTNSNVPPYGDREGMSPVDSDKTLTYSVISKGGTLEQWTPEDLRDAGII
jgi:predicted transcriptional regulator